MWCAAILRSAATSSKTVGMVTEPARMFASLQVAALGEAESLDLPRIISEEPAARIEEWERAC